MPPLSASAIAVEDRPAQAAIADATRAPRAVAPARIRLLLLTDTSIAFAGGSERFLRNLATMLPRDRYAVTVVQLDAGHHAGAGRHALSDASHVDLRNLPVDAVYGPGGWLALRALRSLLREGGFDIVQSQHEKSDLLNALLPRRPGRLHLSNRRDMGFKKSARLKQAFRLLNHRFDCVVAPSQPVLGELARSEALDPARMLWIPNGVDTQRFRPRQGPAREAMRQALRLGRETIAFGCVARFTPEKRHVDLVDAFARVRATAPQARLLLVGDGPLRAEVEARATALGVADAVDLLGMRPDVESVLPALDAGVLASSTEGMSNAILEMMACGLPVVATAVGGNPSLVRDGATGLLAPPLAPDALGDAMSALAADAALRTRLGVAGRARIEGEFSLAAMVRSFDQAYQRLLEA
jgi:glycosyltransferase involved in cell wall biosynthesis